MISKVACIIGKGTNPYRNMAVEAHLWQMAVQDTAILFLWRCDPCVELGCGQDIAQNCDQDGILQQRFYLTRRPAGGDAFYLDENAIGYSIIVPRDSWDIHRQREILQIALSRLQIHVRSEAPYTLSMTGNLPVARQTYLLNSSTGMERGVLYLQTDPITADHALNHAQNYEMHGLRERQPGLTAFQVMGSLCDAAGAVYGVKPYWLNEFLFDPGVLAKREKLLSDASWIELKPITDQRAISGTYAWGSLTVGLTTRGGIITDCTLRSNAMEAALLLELEDSLMGTPCLIGAVSGRVEQKVNQLPNHYLKRLMRDSCTLICERISRNDFEEMGSF